MASAIEDIIDELEEYIDSCKPSSIFNDTKIVVNRDDIEGLLEELRAKTPEEIRRYQKIISNKEAILADARAKADQIVQEAQITTNELVSEHQIMQQAYAQANEVILIAQKNAQEKTWENVGQGVDITDIPDITGDHVNKEQDVFIVFE